jgi:hypothetical protein
MWIIFLGVLSGWIVVSLAGALTLARTLVEGRHHHHAA